jgi:hypothetical protein
MTDQLKIMILPKRLRAPLIAIILLIPCISAMAQKTFLVPYRDGNLWGFADTTMNVVIKPQFEEAGFFREENNLYYATGKLNGEEIIIMEDGTHVKDEFSSGTSTIGFGIEEILVEESNTDASLSRKGLHGYRMDENRILSLAPVYSDFMGFVGSDERAIVFLKDNKKAGVIDPKGKIIIPFDYDQILVINYKKPYMAGLKSGKWQLFDVRHKPVVQELFDEIYPHYSVIRAKKNGRYGYLDKEGKEVIPFKYNVASDFGDAPASLDYAWVTSGGASFFIDKKGREFRAR